MHIDIASIVTAVFAVQNISQKFQTLALARLPRVQEVVRRAVFQEAVKQRDWKTTKLLADHSLYDDQRGWALGEALNERQWDVVVVLAEHGLTGDQLRKVYRQVAKRAGLDTVRQLYDQAVDMRLVCEELMAANPSRERPPNKEAIDRLRNRGDDVTKLEAEYRERRERVAKAESEHKKRCYELEDLDVRYSCCGGINFERPLSSRQWYGLMSKLRRFAERPTGDCVHLVDKAIEHAIADNAWHVVMHLVRFGMDASKRDSVFLQALRQNQWGVARLLLEYGVSVELSRAALQDLMEANQWILVARVMELSLDDTERRRVMQAALDKKEGSVVAHGISVMEGRLSVEEREVMYDQALSQGVWQAVKRLVEEKDNTGIAQRDKALVSAVEHRQWDIVAHCELHGADMDKQDSDGDTMLLRAVKDSDFEAVTELVQLGANQFLADADDLRVLDIAIDEALNYGRKEAWDTVKLLVEFHGDINRPDPTGRSPLHKLIASRNWSVRIADNVFIPDGVIKAKIIDTALLWGRDVCQKEANFHGKTALHVVSRAGLWDAIRYLVARGADPLSVTREGMTMLWMGVKNESFPKKLLQECIKLGVSSHQPAISDTARRVVAFPMFAALKKRSLELARMLYESGACSGPDLYRLNTDDRINQNRAQLRSATAQKPFESDEDFSGQVHTPGDNTASVNSFGSRQAELEDLNEIEELAVLEYIHQIATTPRRLTSLCRVAISHYVGVWKPRERNKRVEKLPLPRPMKDYVLFRDLTRT
nr:hypothetical protein BaRGS_015749 [Batillaria attramentaria]